MTLGPCTRCKEELSTRPHWTNLMLHHDCLEANERDVEAMHARLHKPPQPWSDDTPLRGSGVPREGDGQIKYLIEYLLTIYKRFGNTAVTFNVKWGASALWKRDEQAERIIALEQEVAEQREGIVEECMTVVRQMIPTVSAAEETPHHKSQRETLENALIMLGPVKVEPKDRP